VRPALPAYLDGLMSKPEAIRVMKNDPSQVEAFVRSVSRAAKQGIS
jgi:threonine synthase